MLLPNALTTYANVKGDLGLPDDTLQTVVERQINAASAAIRQYCGREFAFNPQRVETIAVPTGILDTAQQGALTTTPVQTGVTRLVLSLTPLQSVASVVVEGDAYDPATYSIEDASAGFVFNEYGWESDPVAYIGTARDAVAGFDDPDTVVTYAGGWLAPQFAPAGAWAAGTYAVGQVIVDGNGHAWGVILAGASSGSPPTWPSSPVPGMTTQPDGGVMWLALTGVPATLPADLEEACIITASTLFLKRGTDRTIASQKVGDLSTTFATRDQAKGAGEGGLLPDVVVPMLSKFKRLS